MFSEFMKFLSDFNVVGVAVGLLVATKVGELVKVLIEDLITPLILNPALTKLKVKKIEELNWRGVLYGKVIATLIDFLIVALIIFLIIKSFGVQVK